MFNGFTIPAGHVIGPPQPDADPADRRDALEHQVDEPAQSGGGIRRRLDLGALA